MSRVVELLERMRSFSSSACLEWRGGSCSYAQLLNEIDRWQALFDELDITPGTVVAIRADYSQPAVAALLALLSRQALAAMIPRDRKIAPYLVDAHASALLDFDADGNYQWTRIDDTKSNPLLDRLRASGESGIILFTSGSTGTPKAAVHSIERFLYKLGASKNRFRTLAFMLFDHVGGVDTLFCTLAVGGAFIFPRRRDPASILEIIESHKVEALTTSPSFLRLLCATQSGIERDLSSLRVIAYSAEPMDQRTLRRINTRFPNARISQKYGTTETGSPRSVSRANDSLWLKLKSDVEMKIIDNILWIRGEGTILGYLNAPSPVDDDGWYCTGDLVETDGEWIKICGRKTDTINVGGEKVSPTEVEQSILELDFVRDTVVSAQAHELMGQIVAARVSLVAPMDEKDAAARIRSHCRAQLAPHKVPVRIEITTESFTNDRQKAQRTQRAD